MRKYKRFYAIFISLIVVAMATFLSACGTKVTLINGEDRSSVSLMGEYEISVPENPGYQFLGWFDAAEGGTAYTDTEGKGFSSWDKSYPTTLYAQWSLKTYTFTLDVAGGTMEEESSFELLYLSIMDDLPVPTKAGYMFGGWCNSKNEAVTDSYGRPTGTYSQFTAAGYPVDDTNNTVTLYAKWTEKVVTYSFSTNGGTEVSAVTAGLGETFVLPVAAKESCSFLGWIRGGSGNSDNETAELEELLPTRYTALESDNDSTTFYAVFKPATVAGVTFTAINSDKEYSVQYTGSEKEVYIPEIYQGKPVTQVTKISTSVETLFLPNSVTKINDNAMKDCTSLSYLRLPASLESISKGLLQNCSSLTELYIPAGVTSIGENALSGTMLKTVSVPAGVRSIGDDALRSLCLERIDVESGNTYYESIDGVLYQKQGTVYKLQQYPVCRAGSEYTPDERTVQINAKAFYKVGYDASGKRIDDYLKKVTISGKITKVEEYAFAYSSLVRVEISLSQSVSPTFAGYVFFYCSSLRMVNISLNQPFTLGSSVFGNTSAYIYVPTDAKNSYMNASGWSSYSSKIRTANNIFGDFAVESVSGGVSVIQYLGYEEEVEVPEYINGMKVVKIGDSAFKESTELKKITLPSSVTTIGANAFANCTNLESLYIKAATPPSLGSGALTGTSSEFKIYVDGEAVTTYRAANGWSTYADIIFTKS